jgi:Beta-lactamase superfamily domain
MFDVTFLGHQGWLIETRSTRILVDPLLGPGLGNMPEDGLDVFPPREIDFGAFPPIDAVVATHEHSDHLSIPSLLRLDRRIPVFLPARSSLAAKTLVRELGFRLEPLQTGEKLSVGDLELFPFPPGEATQDEWDVRPLLIRDREGHGSLATSIDAVESPAFAEFALDRAGRLGVWSSSHNHMDIFPVREGGTQERERDVNEGLARSLRGQFERNFARRPKPEVLALLASGFSFKDDLAWMNRHAFPGQPPSLAAAIGTTLGVPVRALLPGQRLSLVRGALVEESASRPFFSTPDPSHWPPHSAEVFSGALPDFGPASGTREFSTQDLDGLLDALREFASHLYGGPLFRALYAAGDDAMAGRRATVGFAVRTPSETLTLAYRPEACAFEHVPHFDPRSELVAGLACWGSDLRAILRFELLSGYMLIGRYRKWNHAAPRFACDLDGDLMLYTHPLRHPDRTLRLYRETASALAKTIGPELVPASAEEARA